MFLVSVLKGKNSAINYKQPLQYACDNQMDQTVTQIVYSKLVKETPEKNNWMYAHPDRCWLMQRVTSSWSTNIATNFGIYTKILPLND